MATVQVCLGAAIILVLAPFTATTPVDLSWPVVLSVAALGIAGTGLAYLWNTNIVAAWGATNASTVTYLTPVVGVTLGIAVRGEAISWNEPVGALIVIAGIALSQGGVPPRPRPQAPASVDVCRSRPRPPDPTHTPHRMNRSRTSRGQRPHNDAQARGVRVRQTGALSLTLSATAHPGNAATSITGRDHGLTELGIRW